MPILLVEDDPMDVELTLRALEKHRLSNPVFVVRDGEEALDYVFRRAAYASSSAAPLPGLVLLDMRLPKLGGLEVLQALREHPAYRQVPVVMLTTCDDDADIRRSYELGANSYIVKPVGFQDFMEVVGRIGLYWILTNVTPSRE